MDEVNIFKCQSVKSKKDVYHQCPKCKKGDQEFCGIHLRYKKCYKVAYRKYLLSLFFKVIYKVTIDTIS